MTNNKLAMIGLRVSISNPDLIVSDYLAEFFKSIMKIKYIDDPKNMFIASYDGKRRVIEVLLKGNITIFVDSDRTIVIGTRILARYKTVDLARKILSFDRDDQVANEIVRKFRSA